ncbi:MAG: tRNA (adenosine(37)-N6)-threonylcarbamoyltransferase complex dimerization subunit type 1 TsaB [Alphaproteobacteria bacterium]
MDKIKYILAMDTTGGSASVCVYDCENEKSLADTYEDIPFSQGEVIIPMIDNALRQSGINKSDIDAIGVCKGPGFFTGMRICLSTANALALGLNKPLYAVDSLSAIAFELNQDKITVLQETKRSDLYVATFDGGKMLGDITATEINDIKIGDEVLTGSGLNRYLETNEVGNKTIAKDFPTSVAVAGLISYNIKNNIDCTDTTALYLRPADVSMPKNKK